MRFQARMEADSILKKLQEVVLRIVDGHLIEGRFLYLRDFGSVLLVREMNADMKAALGFRWLKEGSYGSYTVLDTKTEARRRWASALNDRVRKKKDETGNGQRTFQCLSSLALRRIYLGTIQKVEKMKDGSSGRT